MKTFASFRRSIARRCLGTLMSVQTNHKVAALTFDDGPDPDFTPRLLELFRNHDVHGTFFMVGERALDCPALVRQAAGEGHAVGNHSWNHPSFSLIGRRERMRQLTRTAAALAPFGARLFRPPYGHLDPSSRFDCFLRGYDTVGWSVDAEDWRARDPKEVAGQLEEEIVPGSITVLHDSIYDVREPGDVNREFLIAALEEFLAGPGKKFRFVTVPELLRQGVPRRKNWFNQAELSWMRETGTGWKDYYANLFRRTTGPFV